MKRIFSLAALAAVVATGTAAAQAVAPVVVVTPGTVVAEAPATPAMQKLMETSHRLRDAIHVLAQKPAGPERDAALATANEALLATQRAMLDLPPDMRMSGPVSNTSGYDASVQALMNAADALHASIHAMATRPAGPQRNQAIRDANRALLDTQVAMANAYDATAFPRTTSTLGAAGSRTITLTPRTMQCTDLGTMIGCR